MSHIRAACKELGISLKTVPMLPTLTTSKSNVEHSSTMGRLDYQRLTRRKRPHFQPLNGTLFITFRLAGSIPKSTVRYFLAKRNWLKDQLRRVEEIATQAVEHRRWLAQLEQLNRDWFLKCEDILHREAVGPIWMRDGRVADTVAQTLHQLDDDIYRLDAFSIMSNHVHTVFRPLVSEDLIEEIVNSQNDVAVGIPALSKIMHTIKGRSARACNLILGRSGAFWEHESFDHVIRAGKFEKTIRYVLHNPVKIGVVQNWEDYRWNYCRKDWIDRFRSPLCDML
jgi:putative transposase